MGPTATVLLNHVPGAEEVQRLGQLVDEISPHFGRSLGILETDEYHEYPEEDRREILLPTSFHVRSWYSLDSPTNGHTEHEQLGRACLSVARPPQGLIDFGGALLPHPPAHMLQGMWLWEHVEWSDVEPFFSEMVRSIPGAVFTLPYQTAGGRSWASHVCDVQFMAAWLTHPWFHMIK